MSASPHYCVALERGAQPVGDGYVVSQLCETATIERRSEIERIIE